MIANDQQLKIRTAILLLFAIVSCCVLWRSHGAATPASAILPAPIAVEVMGDVPMPGIYLLDSDHAGFSDALRAAGWTGACPGENRKMKSGESLTVRSNGPDPFLLTGRMPAAARLAVGLKLDLNQASAQDLLLIPQMRPDVASAIVKRRELKAWRKVEDLMELQGIGPKTSQRLASFLEALPRGEGGEVSP